jgi:beta-aspartyl-peptidase (threonine type)
MEERLNPVIIVHGGAGELPEELAQGKETGCRKAAMAGMKALNRGGSPLDAVEQASRYFEEDPVFNAGRGSCYTRESTVEVDGSIMDGAAGNFGAVGAVPNLLYPVSLARKVMEEGEHNFLAGKGAIQFANEMGFRVQTFEDLATDKARDWLQAAVERRKQGEASENYAEGNEESGDTVGACTIDSKGNMAVAVSTGGMNYKRTGRVGDTPILGAGFYIENDIGAAGGTGVGEAMMKTLMCLRAVDMLKSGLGCEATAKKSIEMVLEKTKKECGIIVIDKSGNTGLYHSTPFMPWAVIGGQGDIKSGISKDRSVLS